MVAMLVLAVELIAKGVACTLVVTDFQILYKLNEYSYITITTSSYTLLMQCCMHSFTDLLYGIIGKEICGKFTIKFC